MYDKDPKRGIKALSNLLVGQYGMSQELVRTLVLKYPRILNKSDTAIVSLFDYLKGNKGIEELTAMKLIFDVPVLLSEDVPAKAKEIEELFYVYHGITADEVTQIFLSFPYLYCCQTFKIQRWMAEFRKYRFTKEQIINLVSQSASRLLL